MRIRNVLIILLFVPLVSCYHEKKEKFDTGSILKSIKWKLYTQQNSGLPASEINEILIDKKGNKWITTAENQGLIKLSASGEWTLFNTSNSEIPDNMVYSLVLDNDDNLWLATNSAGIVKYDGTNWTSYNSSNTTMRYDLVYQIGIDKKNIIWFSNCTPETGGLMSYDGADCVLYTPDDSKLPTHLIYKIFVDPDDNVWLAPGIAAAVRFSEGEWTIFKKIYALNTQPYQLTDFCSDNSGNVWASSDAKTLGHKTGGTLLRFKGEKWTEYLPSDAGRTNDKVRCIACDKYSNVWISLIEESLNTAMFNGKEWFFLKDLDENFPEFFGMWDMAFDGNGVLWGTIPWEGFGLLKIEPVYE